jgi:uncharacterized protein YcbX
LTRINAARTDSPAAILVARSTGHPRQSGMPTPPSPARMHVSGLFIYPVKSLRGCAVQQAPVDALGLTGDRRFLVVDANDRFLTQRVLPQMARVSTRLADHELILSGDRAGEIAVPLRAADQPKRRTVTVWKSEGLITEDCGDATAAWLTDVLGTPCRLVRIGDAFRRPVLKPAAVPGDVFAFNDAVPFLMIGEASLADLNDRLAERGEEPVPMNRFRPNVVVAGAAPYAEDEWSRVRVGTIALRAAGPCVRCVVTTTDQVTGERGIEPLRTLAAYRRFPPDPTGVIFGQNYIHETKAGTLRVGDAVEPV